MIDINDGSHDEIFCETVVKVCDDLRQMVIKWVFYSLKWAILLHFVKINIFATRVIFYHLINFSSKTKSFRAY